MVRPLGLDSLRRQNSWKNMSEIKFLQSCPWLDIATHAPCAIDSGFESVGKLHHLWSWGARWSNPWAQGRSCSTWNTQATGRRCPGQPVCRRDRPSGCWALGGKQRSRRPPSHCYSPWPLTNWLAGWHIRYLVGESRQIFSTSDTDKPATPPSRHAALAGLARPAGLVRENGG